LRGVRWTMALLASIVVAASCVPGGGQRVEDSPFDEARWSQQVLLTVQNNEFMDATIHARWNGLRERVGMVTGKTSQTFRMEWRGEYIRLEIGFIGSREGYTSELVGVSPGDHLDFVIMPVG
jgi:hypothetical protein